MRNFRALAAAGAAVAVLGMAAPAATAGGDHNTPSNIVALPSVIARGGQMTVTVDGCPQDGTTTSDEFGETSRGTATSSNPARPGSCDITDNCSGRTLTRPIGGVHGGLGGSSSSGATPTDTAIGSGLVTAAVVGAGLFWMRRRSERRI